MERLGHPTGRASSPPSVPEFSSPVGRASCRAEAVGRLSIRLAIHAPTRIAVASYFAPEPDRRVRLLRGAGNGQDFRPLASPAEKAVSWAAEKPH